MSRRLILLAAAAALAASAQILPEQFGSLKRAGGAEVAPPADAELWADYGFEAGEKASYGGVTLTAWRFADATAAFAAWQSLGGDRRRDLSLSGNYLLQTDGSALSPADLGQLAGKLPKRSTSAQPPLLSYLPDKGRLSGSERYILGGASLARFEPRLERELVSFERGAEALTARYRVSGREAQLTVISYPTPQIAIERLRQYQRIWGDAARRTGPIITVVPEAKDAPAAAKLLGSVSYAPKLSWTEYVSKDTPQDAARMILAISVLAGGLIVASLAFGIFFGGWKIIARKFGLKAGDEELTSLHIGSL